MTKVQKIQSLLIQHLLQEGHIQLTLPDGMVVEVGILQENREGKLEKTDDYCWLIASQKERTISMDSYNFGLTFPSESGKIIVEDSTVNQEGQNICVLTAC
jgi:hypothetical protein